jgi:hypothetical protein
MVTKTSTITKYLNSTIQCSQAFKYYLQDLINYFMRSTLFWDYKQHRMAVPHRRFGTTYQSHLQVFFLDCLNLEYETFRLSRNVGMELQFYTL